MKIPFIKFSKLWLTIASVTMIVCLSMLAVWRLKPGIDFTGGSLLEVTFNSNLPSIEALQSFFKADGHPDVIIQKSGDLDYIIRTEFLTEEQHQMLVQKLKDTFGTKDNKLTEGRFETIGGAVSKQLRTRAVWSVIMVSLGIIAYLAYAFRGVSRRVPSWQYGVMAVVAMLHDVILTLGIFAALGHFLGVEVDIAFVIAILTVLGYSVNDTIVVYDRIRENLLHHNADNFAEVVNNGLNDTLMRSLNTTLTVLLPLFALYFVGGPTIHYFALALLIGMASGAYSSIFIASPLLVVAEKWRRQSA